MIIWGKWKSVYSEPVQLNMKLEDEANMKECIIDLISAQEFCLYLTENGSLHSMGENIKGMMGLGKITVNTCGKSVRVQIPERIMEIKVGYNHVLALTDQGQVYSWGQNNHGQVGKIGEQVVWEPVKVYPLNDNEEDYDRAKQIEVFEDSSFLVTEEGTLYSWGKNDQGFLGRDSKLDLKPQQSNSDKLAFSNHTPQRIAKLSKFKIHRIQIKDGKFLAYFLAPPSQSQDLSSHAVVIDETRSVANIRDSEIDSEEEKDIVVGDFGQKIQMKKMSRRNMDKNSSSSLESSMRSSLTSSTLQTGMSQSNFQTGSKLMTNKTNKDLVRRYSLMNDTLKKSCEIRDDLQKFDRLLADSMKPLLDLQPQSSNSTTLYHQVLDKFAQGTHDQHSAEELRMAIDKMQLQFKRHSENLESIERKINDQVRDHITQTSHELRRQGNSVSLEDEALFKEMQVHVDLLMESVTLKKFNLLGCKMKIYQDRMKEINFLELLSSLREDEREDDGIMAQERQRYLLKQCKLLCKKTQASMKKNADYYLQLHLGCSIPSSLALSTMTNGVYSQCDLWLGLSTLTQYTSALQIKINETDLSHERIRKLWSCFQKLQETDFDKKVDKYQERQGEYPSTKDWFDAIMREIHGEVKDVMHQVRSYMKENATNSSCKDITVFFQTLIHDSALIRQLLFSAQQALFEGAHQPPASQDENEEQVQSPPTPGLQSNEHLTMQERQSSSKIATMRQPQQQRVTSNQEQKSFISNSSSHQSRPSKNKMKVQETPDEYSTPQEEATISGKISGFLGGILGAYRK